MGNDKRGFKKTSNKFNPYNLGRIIRTGTKPRKEPLSNINCKNNDNNTKHENKSPCKKQTKDCKHKDCKQNSNHTNNKENVFNNAKTVQSRNSYQETSKSRASTSKRIKSRHHSKSSKDSNNDKNKDIKYTSINMDTIMEKSINILWNNQIKNTMCNINFDNMNITDAQISVEPYNGNHSNNNSEEDNGNPVILDARATKKIKKLLGYINWMKRKEDKFSIPDKNYLKTNNKNYKVKAHMRKILFTWMLEVSEEYLVVSKETLHMAFNYVDRFISMEREKIKAEILQLVGVCALLIAAKVNETFLLTTVDLVRLTADTYSDEEVRYVEKIMLSRLGWDTLVVTPYCYLVNFLEIIKNIDIQEMPTRKIVENRLKLVLFDPNEASNEVNQENNNETRNNHSNNNSDNDSQNYQTTLLDEIILDLHYIRYEPSLIAASIVKAACDHEETVLQLLDLDEQEDDEKRNRCMSWVEEKMISTGILEEEIIVNNNGQ